MRPKLIIQAQQFWRDRRAQDMIEYALMASVVAVACGAILPPVSNSISYIFSKITSLIGLVP
jgi:Flp pilus assembly pilin Flp